jgi:hypothetical protein
MTRVTFGPRLVVVGLLALVAGACQKPSPEAAVRQKVVLMSRAAEGKDLGAVMAQISERFKSADGWSKAELKSFLAGHLLRGTWVRVFLVDLEVKATSASAVAFSGRFLFGRSDAKDLRELAGKSDVDAYGIDGTFELDPDGEWRVVKARHRRLAPTDLF